MWNRLRPYLSWMTAGQLDAGLASLGTFAVGLYAVRSLPAADLGAYALMFSAFAVVSQFAAQLIYTPSEVHAVGWDRPTRLSVLRGSIRKGTLVAVVSSVGMIFAAVPLLGAVSTDTLVAFVASGMLLSMVSPTQDHIRRVMHLAGRSWRAATMSVVFVVAVIGGLVGVGSVSPVWAPFGGLFVGNVFSIGLARVWVRAEALAPDSPSYRELVESGKWLLGVGLASTGFGYLSATLVRLLAGVDVLGYVEGARVAAQPINIIALGLVAFIAPQAMEAAIARDATRARRWRVRFLALMTAVALPYALWIAPVWEANPLPGLMPNAYVIEGLVAVSLIVAFLNSASSPWRAELMAARQERVLGKTAAVTGSLESGLVAATAGFIGGFSLPIGHGIGGALRWLVYHLRLARWYRDRS